MISLLLSSFSFSPHTLADLEPIPPVILSPKEYAEKIITDRWGYFEWLDFRELIQRESKWIPTAQNPKSTAYGLGQFLNSTWKSVGCVKTSDPVIQLDCTADYVAQRYGSPSKALKFHKTNNWY